MSGVLRASINSDLKAFRARERACEKAWRGLTNQSSAYAQELRGLHAYLAQLVHFAEVKEAAIPWPKLPERTRRRTSEQDEPDHWLADSGDDGQP